SADPNPSLAGQRNSRPFPALAAAYYPGLDHEAHNGHGVDGGKYRGYLTDHTDESIGDLVGTLRDLGEFHNKIFVLTTDHGHTRITDDPSEHTPCKANLPDMADVNKRDAERKGNTNLHIWELARIVQQGKKLLNDIRLPGLAPAFSPSLAVSANLG